MEANEKLLKFTEHLVSISEFSKGKTSDARNDFKKFDRGAKRQVLKGIYKVSQNPLL